MGGIIYSLPRRAPGGWFRLDHLGDAWCKQGLEKTTRSLLNMTRSRVIRVLFLLTMLIYTVKETVDENEEIIDFLKLRLEINNGILSWFIRNFSRHMYDYHSGELMFWILDWVKKSSRDSPLSEPRQPRGYQAPGISREVGWLKLKGTGKNEHGNNSRNRHWATEKLDNVYLPRGFSMIS